MTFPISYEELTDEVWLAYLWWKDWLNLWRLIGLAEEQWVELYTWR